MKTNWNNLGLFANKKIGETYFRKFRKKPIIIEAVQYTGDNKRDIIDFTEGKATTNTCYSHLTIPTLEGNHKADVGDWIIKGIKGEFYPCKNDIFKLTYEEEDIKGMDSSSVRGKELIKHE